MSRLLGSVLAFCFDDRNLGGFFFAVLFCCQGETDPGRRRQDDYAGCRRDHSDCGGCRKAELAQRDGGEGWLRHLPSNRECCNLGWDKLSGAALGDPPQVNASHHVSAATQGGLIDAIRPEQPAEE